MLRRGAVVTAAVGGLSSRAIAGPGGGNGPGQCDVLVDASGSGDATTIQGGVDAAEPGATVCIADGTYTEQVRVETDLTLTAAPGASPTIEMPASPSSFTVPESGNSFEAVLLVGPTSGPSTVDVTVTGIDIDGRDQQPTAGVAVGLLERNTTGTIGDVSVRDMAVGGKQTGGVAMYGDSDVTVRDCTVDGYERFGIVANGDGDSPAPTVDVRRNDVTGSGDGSETAWGPNGIQVGYGADGTVQGNVVDQNRYAANRPVASGIIVFESDGVTVRGNTVTDADVGLACGTYAWFRQTASGNRFVGNEVEGAVFGVRLSAIAYDGYSTTDPTIEDVKVTNNELTQGGVGSASASVGIGLSTVDADPDYDPVIEDVKVITNDVDGFATTIDDEGTDTKTAANAFGP